MRDLRRWELELPPVRVPSVATGALAIGALAIARLSIIRASAEKVHLGIENVPADGETTETA
jgi:hypothetical protein